MTINLNTTANAGATLPLGQAKTQPATMPAGGSAPAPTLPPLAITVKKKLPSGVASNVKQHVLFLLDKSSSMAGEKIMELDLAMASILAALGDADNKDGFRVTILPFNHGSSVLCSAVPVTSVPALNLVASGGTNFDSPLKKAIAEIDAFKAQPNPDGWHFLQPQVLFLSDGQASVTDANIQDLQERANVTAVAYGSDANQATLSRLASDGQVHVVGTNGGALRGFMAQVGATMVSTMKAAI